MSHPLDDRVGPEGDSFRKFKLIGVMLKFPSLVRRSNLEHFCPGRVLFAEERAFASLEGVA
jgi:hypothetical protein